MRETIYRCDCCGIAEDVQQISVATRSYLDGAGNTDTEDLNFELCVGCMGRFAIHLLTALKTTAPETTLNWLIASNTNYRKG